MTNHNNANQFSQVKRTSQYCILLLLLMAIITNVVLASGGMRYRKGTIAAKGTVRSAEGNPFWVEYDEKGQVVTMIGEAKDTLEGAEVMSANTFWFHISLFETVENEHSAHREILSREEYATHGPFGHGHFTDAADNLFMGPGLAQSTRSVIVRTKETIFSKDDLILLESPLLLTNLQENYFSTSKPENKRVTKEETQTILLSRAGELLHAAKVDIGYRVALYTKGEYGTTNDDINMYGEGDGHLGGYNRYDNHKLWRPMEGVYVKSGLGRMGTTTNENGYYSASHYIPPCPGFALNYENKIYATLHYDSFNPNSKGQKSYYATYPDYDVCVGYSEGLLLSQPTLGELMTSMALMGIESNITDSVLTRQNLNFAIDTTMLTGEAELRNPNDTTPLPQSSRTSYTYEPVEFTPSLPAGTNMDSPTDLNNNNILEYQTDFYPDDNKTDIVELDSDNNTISLWLGLKDSSPESDPPDLIRRADLTYTAGGQELRHVGLFDQGLLKEISATDLRKTDTYVYRVSNGQLFASREGLSPPENLFRGDISNDSDSTINYRQLIRGIFNLQLGKFGYKGWQSDTGINKDFHDLQSNHLRIGELIKVYMVNRATGYIGSSTVDYGTKLSTGGNLSVSAPSAAWCFL